MNKTNDLKIRTLKTPDGKIVTYFDGKLHNWEGPSIKDTNNKKNNEYHLYGIPYTKDDWLEARRDRNGVSPDKNPQVKTRY
jgi:hypothetical protein